MESLERIQKGSTLTKKNPCQVYVFKEWSRIHWSKDITVVSSEVSPVDFWSRGGFAGLSFSITYKQTTVNRKKKCLFRRERFYVLLKERKQSVPSCFYYKNIFFFFFLSSADRNAPISEARRMGIVLSIPEGSEAQPLCCLLLKMVYTYTCLPQTACSSQTSNELSCSNELADNNQRNGWSTK